jgi:prevent-host-death family protein
MPSTSTLTHSALWRLQDAKAQFSALVDGALRGVPQHVTRRGKQAVVVLSEQDFEALQRSATNATNNKAKPLSLIDHLLAIPKASQAFKADRLDVQPRDIDFS